MHTFCVSFCSFHQCGILQQPCNRFPPYLLSGPASRPNTHYQRPSRGWQRAPHRVPNSSLRCHRLPSSSPCRRPRLLWMPPSPRTCGHNSRMPPSPCRDKQQLTLSGPHLSGGFRLPHTFNRGSEWPRPSWLSCALGWDSAKTIPRMPTSHLRGSDQHQCPRTRPPRGGGRNREPSGRGRHK